MSNRQRRDPIELWGSVADRFGRQGAAPRLRQQAGAFRFHSTAIALIDGGWPAIAKSEQVYPKARPSSGFFPKNKPPCRVPVRARLPWFCSKSYGFPRKGSEDKHLGRPAQSGMVTRRDGGTGSINTTQ